MGDTVLHPLDGSDDKPLDPYSGPPFQPSDIPELTDEQRDEEIVMFRLHDEPGKDVAYEIGLSPVFRPCPPGGRTHASREELLP
jgi:hypothetical protein